MRFFVFLFSLVSLSVHAAGIETKQDSLVTKPVERIISLAPHTTELLFAAGAGDKIIATVEYSNFPETAKKLPRVGSYNKLDMERILSLQPDLIVTWKTRATSTQVEKLQKLGLHVVFTEPRSLTGIAEELKRLGKLVGSEQKASHAANEYLNKLEQLKSKYQGKNKLRAFYQIWDKPLMTINGEHLISDVMQLCGLENIFANINNLVPRISEEAVLKQDPQVIIAGGMAKLNSEWVKKWQRWKTLSATRHNALIDINPDIIQRHSPRILQGASELCEKADTIRNRVFY